MSLLIFLGGNWKQIKNVLKYWSVLRWKSESEVAQSCLTLCDPVDCNLPGFSVHGIFQARVLEWVAISVSKGSSWLRDWTWVSCITGRRFTLCATREAHWDGRGYVKLIKKPTKKTGLKFYWKRMEFHWNWDPVRFVRFQKNLEATYWTAKPLSFVAKALNFRGLRSESV